MSDFELDTRNIDAMYWSEKFCEIMRETDFVIDEDLMVGWFANYRFAVADPMTAEIERLEQRLKVLQDAYVDTSAVMVDSFVLIDSAKRKKALFGDEVEE